jgi:DnaK suppressor protein
MKTKSHPAPRSPEHGVPWKWRWHHRALQRLRDHLLDDLRLRLAAAAEPIEMHGTDPTDSATDESDRALAVSLLSGERDALHEVDTALRRIREGTYGICERSGKRIPAARLRAVPWTRFTKAAEDAVEKERALRSMEPAPEGSIRSHSPRPRARGKGGPPFQKTGNQRGRV